MKFSDLEFKPHPAFTGATIAKHTFANQWKISVVTGNKSLFLYFSSIFYGVAIIQPNGEYLSGGVFRYQTEEEVDAILEVISKDDIGELDKFLKFPDETKHYSAGELQKIFAFIGATNV